MSKLDWTKADLPNSDPARVSEVDVGWKRDERVIQKRKKRNGKPIKKSRSQTVAEEIAPLVVPESKVGLIASIMRDLRKPFPTKRNRLNNKLNSLIEDGFISQIGEISTDHPLMAEWLEVMETRRKRKV
jgi:hypothetical protein